MAIVRYALTLLNLERPERDIIQRTADVLATDGIEDIRTAGLSDGKPAILIIISRQPGANIIDTVDRIRGVIPQLQAEIPAGMHLAVVMDRTTTIRASAAR